MTNSCCTKSQIVPDFPIAIEDWSDSTADQSCIPLLAALEDQEEVLVAVEYSLRWDHYQHLVDLEAA